MLEGPGLAAARGQFESTKKLPERFSKNVTIGIICKNSGLSGKISVCGFALALALCFALYFCPVIFALALYFALLLYPLHLV